MPKYPDIVVPMAQNQFVLAIRVRRALKRAGHSGESMQYFDQALNARSYSELLKLSQEKVTIK